MEIRENEKVCIITPLNSKLNEYKLSRLIEKINHESRHVAIDLNYMSECSIDFIKSLKDLASKKRIGIFNIPADIFVLFNVMNVDKFVDLYVSELDFKESKRQIINRKFSLI